MKNLLAILILIASISATAQKKNNPTKVKEPSSKIKPDYTKINLSQRASDHLMFQFGVANWGSADAINLKSFNRTFNTYFLFDFPFKSNPKFSAAFGPGIGTDNIYFEKTAIKLNSPSGVTFTADNVTKYKKIKLGTGYLEAPIEFRYSTNPENMNKGWKFAVGAKIGLLVDATVKTDINASSSTEGGYVMKIKDKRYFNTTRVAGTARVGLGNLSLFGSFTLTSFFKEGFGPAVKPFSIGLTLSGL
jgi:hypothetical protein